MPKTLVWDNEAGVGRGRLTAEFAAFAGLLATKIHLCRPRDPEAKGLVERANGYLETSFLPGRTFSGPGDFNTQLTTWLTVANRRVHRTLQTRPTERWEADRAGMLTLLPVDPPAWWRMQTRIGRDHYVRVETNDYSVHPDAIGRTVTGQRRGHRAPAFCSATAPTAGPRLGLQGRAGRHAGGKRARPDPRLRPRRPSRLLTRWWPIAVPG
ncbi:Mu transposase domain-containing protein [Streptomyces sp. NPDC050164]|uniref:Mu transposase domain-containing protein n=1 Tax=Streptomyces sp. NPDC050164 TaxID=3365605 RepID=UPI00378ABD95